MINQTIVRGGVAHRPLVAGLTAGLGMLASQGAWAQTHTLDEIPLEGQETPPPAPATSAASADGAGETVQATIGTGEGEAGDAGDPSNTLGASTGTGRLAGTVQDTPQIINVVPRQILDQQGVTTLEQALQNVPGVTVRIGEGRGGMNGDQFRIRGFEAKGDIFQDGLRDFGVYVRDSFQFESVEVFKGPSSENFGVGTTGGAINFQTKKAHLGDKYHFESTFGTDPLIRGIADINKQLGDTTALRVVGMGTDQEIADRDHNYNDRYGTLIDFGTGIGTDKTWHLSYFYQHYDRVPDYGVPVLTPDDPTEIANFGSIGKPVTEWGVPRDTFYGKETDKDIGNVHSLTSRLQIEANDWLTFNNDTRLAYYDRDFATSVPSCNSDCADDFFAGGDPEIGFGGGNPGYYQESWGFQNVLSGSADFYTGPLRHELIAGLDFLYQHDDRTDIAVDPDNSAKQGSPPSTIWNPIYENTTGYSLYRNPDDLKKSSSANVGIFASDRIWFHDNWSVLAGVRWDYFDVAYDTYDGTDWTHQEQQSDFYSPKVSLIWEPTPDQTYYASWATSASISGQFPTNGNSTLGNDPLEPEENESYELGAKINLLDRRLGLTAALFQIDKNNAYYYDTDGDVIYSGEEQRVRGFEVGLSGYVTDAWAVSLAYSYLDSEIRSDDGDSSASVVGNEVPNVPKNAASLWTTYNLSSTVFQQLPGTWLVGGGIFYRDSVYTNSNNTAEIPASLTVDLMTSYEWSNYKVGLNVYNLTDELNYSGVWSNRTIPASGRTFSLTLGATF